MPEFQVTIPNHTFYLETNTWEEAYAKAKELCPDVDYIDFLELDDDSESGMFSTS